MSELFEGEVEVRFEDLVGEGKKFRDPDAVAKKVIHADQHITNLEAEMAELRTELKARLSVEEMLEKVNKPVAQIQAPTGELPNTPRQEPGSKEDLAAEVQKLLKAEKDKDRREANLDQTRSELKKRFGADYNQKLEQIAKDLSVGKEFLANMAETSPTGFLKLIDSVSNPDRKEAVLPRNSLDTGRAFDMTKARNASYYRELRRENPQKYFSRQIQNEMHAEVLKQGPSFYQ